VDRLYRVGGLRLLIALLFVLMSASIGPALASEGGSATPPAIESTEIPTEEATESPVTETPTEPATAEPTEAATEEATEAPAVEPTDEPASPESTDTSVNIMALPPETSSVVITVQSSDHTIANTLPADASWTVFLEGTEVASDTFAAEDLALPAAIQVDDPVPFGSYDVSVDAGPTFADFTGTLVVDQASESFNVTLVPITVASVSINVSSSNPSIANTLPADASWTVFSGGDEVDSDTFAPEHLALPANIVVSNDVPFGTYSVEVDAGPTFAPFVGTFDVDSTTETFNIVLLPVTVSTVSINLSSADPTVANTLPASANWSVSQNNVVVASDTFAADHRALPQSIAVENPVPFGTYSVTVSAGPRFLPYTATFTVNGTTEAFNISLVPADEDVFNELVELLIEILTQILSEL
jgi:hypothetical protein